MKPTLKAVAAWTSLGLAAACGSSLPTGAASGPAYLVVGDPASLNDSELEVRDRLDDLGFEVRVVEDSDPVPASCGVVVVSKTSESEDLGDRLKPIPCGLVFWEDNQQMLGMLATIDNDGDGGTAWHAVRDEVVVNGDAPSDLRARLSGEVEFYVSDAEITFAPDGDLPASAIVVAELGEPTNGRTAIYAFDIGAPLADGTAAAGRRVYFGLYNDTFRLLTPHGLALFDAAVSWAAR